MRSSLFSSLLALAIAATPLAAEPTPSVDPAVAAAVVADPAVVAGAGALSWSRAVQLGVERNQGLLTERLEQRRRAVRVGAAWAQWSPTLLAQSSARRPYSGPNATPLDRVSYAVGASWQNIIGTRLEALVGVDQPLSGAGPATSGPYEPALSVVVEQPLLRGGWLAGAGLPLTEATLASRIEDELFHDAQNAFVVDVDAAYWDVALAKADLAIKTRSQKRAQDQFDDTRENIRRGILADAEIYVVEENLVIFQAEHLRAGQRLQLARRNLAQLLYLGPDADVDVAEALELGGAAVPDPRGTVEAALQGNPLLLAQRQRVTLARERVRFEQNQTWPSLGLSSAVGVHGSSSDYGAAWGDLGTRPTFDAEVGLRLAIPLDRSSIDAGLESAALSTRREQAELERQENAVRFAVENALTVLRTDLALADSAQRQVTLADQKLQAQMEKYRAASRRCKTSSAFSASSTKPSSARSAWCARCASGRRACWPTSARCTTASACRPSTSAPTTTSTAAPTALAATDGRAA